jgi:phosphomannomutase/phosphoglucomutase
VLVLRFEGKSEAALERIKDSFRAALKQAEPSITAPF